MKSGDPVTVWVERIGPVYGFVFPSATVFNRDMDVRVANGLSRLFEWCTWFPDRGTVRLADAAREGVDWLPGHSDEIAKALCAARALS